LTGAGFDYRAISKMTIPQAAHALGFDSGAGKAISSSEAAAIAQSRRNQVFDRIVTRNGWSPSDLLIMPPGDLCREIQKHGGSKDVDVAALPRQVEEYIRARREGIP
jgi:hypothetical protein